MTPVVLAVVAAATAHVAGQGPLVPGANVNMVRGTSFVGGDPYLQRQNEPSIAVSTRNPCHLLAGANDYRTVDFADPTPLPNEDGETSSPGASTPRDAWLGVYQSMDCGSTWRSALLPGHPFDNSEAGTLSPNRGFTAGADAVVRSGTHGMFFYTGLVFDRGDTSRSQIFVARFIDNNNKERGETIEYVDASVVDSGDPDVFVDKPWVAVDQPRANAQTCDINGQRFPAGRVYVAWARFEGGGSRIMFAQSSNCGQSWQVQPLTDVSAGHQGASIAIAPHDGTVHVAWRRFAREGIPAAVQFASLRDGAVVSRATIAPINAFDQQKVENRRFRTNSLPTVAADHLNRVYVAWAERGFAAARPSVTDGDARIVLAVSTDAGLTFRPRYAIDDFEPAPGVARRGHQVMPSLTFTAGKLQAVYYDFSDDITGTFNEWVDEAETPTDPNNPSVRRRHTVDVRAAHANPAIQPTFVPILVTPNGTSPRLSQYRTIVEEDGTLRQVQFNPPNLPLFVGGTTPFIGDYIDVAGLSFVPFQGAWRHNNATTTGPRYDGVFPATPVFHAAWTDHRDVRPPADGDWTLYRAPGDPFWKMPGSECVPDRAGMRNANLYTARITPGLYAGSPGNTKPLGYQRVNGTPVIDPTTGRPVHIQRGFVVFVQNTLPTTKKYLFRIVNQPGSVPGDRASFLRAPAPPFSDADLAQRPYIWLVATVSPLSTTSRTVFVTSANERAMVRVDVLEVAPNTPVSEGTDARLAPLPLAGGLRATVLLNPDPTNPSIEDPDFVSEDVPQIAEEETHDPQIFDPVVTAIDNVTQSIVEIRNPDEANPDEANPDEANPDEANRDEEMPDEANPDEANPDEANPDEANPDEANPDEANLALRNTALGDTLQNTHIVDVQWKVRNNGNTTTSFRFSPTFSGDRTNRHFQLLVTKRYYVPDVDSKTCTLGVRRTNQVLVNVPAFQPRNPDEANPDEANPDEANPDEANPDEANPDEANPDEANPDEANATFYLAPGETATATLRIYGVDSALAPPPVELGQIEQAAGAVIESQAVNTGEAVPPRDEAGADLVAVNVAASPANVAPGATAQVTWTLANRGTDPTRNGFRARFLLSTDRAISDDDTELALVTYSDPVPPDDPATTGVDEGEIPQATNVTLPAGAASGTRYILVLVDAANTVPEADEVNNANAVQLGGAYALRFTTQPTTVTHGFAFAAPIQVQAVDALGAPAPASAVPLVQLAIASGPSGATIGGTLTILTIGGTATFTDITLSMPGTYTLIARAAGIEGPIVPNPAVSSPFAIEVDDPPQAIADTYEVAPGAVLDTRPDATRWVVVNDIDEIRSGPGVVPAGRTLQAAVVSQPTSGSVALDPNGGFLYTQFDDVDRTDFFTYRLNDGVQTGNIATVRIVVGAGSGNAAPVAASLNVTTEEDAPISIDVLRAALDADGDAMTIASASALNGTAVVAGGRIRYTPASNYSGSDTVTYQISDGRGGVGQGTVAVTITPVNDDPVANDDGPFGVEPNSGQTAFAVLANDNDGPESDETLTIVAVGAASRGSVTFTATEVRYTPHEDETGADSFSYEISDGNGGTAAALVRVSVGDANHTPHADDDSATLAEDEAINIPVLANDTDHESDDLTIVSFTQGDHGDVEFGPGGTLRYQPAPNYHGPDTFTYRITDGASFDIGTVRVTVTSVNDSPETRPDHTTTVRDTAVEVDVVSNDIDVEKCPACTPLQYGGEFIFFSSARGATTAGQLHIWAVRPDGTDLTQVTVGAVVDRVPQLRSDGRTLAFQRTVAGSQQIWALDLVTRAAARLIGPDEVQGDASFPSWSPDGTRLAFRVTAGEATHVWVTPYPTTIDGFVRVTPPTGVRTWPSWAPDNALLVGRQVGEGATAFAIYRVDIATGAETELISFTGGEALPKVSFDGSRFLWASLRHAPAGDIYIAPLGGASPVPAAEQRRVTPASGYSEAAWSPEGHRVVASNAAGDLVVFNEDGSGELEIVGDSAIDSAPWWGRVAPAPPRTAEPGRLTVISVTDPAHGLAEVLTDGRVRYTPDPGFTGSDTLEYIVSDGNAVFSTDTGQVLVAVIGTGGAANANPTANDDATTAPEDTQLTLDVVANDVDPDGHPLFVSALPTVGVGGVIVHPGDPASVIYTPPPNFHGVDAFTYTISDGRGGTDTAQVVVTLTPVNDAPIVAIPLADLTVDEDAPATEVGLGSAFTDVDGDALTYSVASNTNPALVTANVSGATLTLQYTSNRSGTAQIGIAATDPSNASVTDTFTVTVGTSNDEPVAVDDAFTTSEDIAGISYGVLANDTDPDAGDVLRVTSVTQAAHGAVDFDSETATTVRYIPELNFNGADEFTYTVGDGHGGIDTATVRVTVTPVNDAPTVQAPLPDLSVPEDSPPTQRNLSAHFFDVDGDALTYSVDTNSSPDLVTASINGAVLTLTYAADQSGVAEIAIRATDPAAASVVDAFSVTVQTAPPPQNVNGPGTTVVSYFNPEPLPPEAIPPVAAFAKASVFNPAPVDEDIEPPLPFGSATTVSVFNPAPVDTADEPPKVMGAAMVVSFLNPAEDEDPAQEPTPFGAAMVVSFFNPAPVEGPGATPTPFGGFSLASFAVGPSVHDVTPAAMSLSATMPQILTVSGENLDGVTAVTLSETTGITVGSPLVAPDGRSLTVSIVLAANAPQGAVRVSVSSPLGSSVVTERTYFMIMP